MQTWAEEDNHFGERLKQLREERQLSQMRLGNEASITQTHINKLEKGTKIPCLRSIEKLADAMRIHPGYFWISGSQVFESPYYYEVLRNEDGLFDIRIYKKGSDGERSRDVGSDFREVEELMLKFAALRLSPTHLADAMDDYRFRKVEM